MTAQSGPSAELGTQNLEKLTGTQLDVAGRAELLDTQTECTFVYTNEDGWPCGVVMSYIQVDGVFWLTAVEGRGHVRALARDQRVSIVVSSAGSGLPGRRMLSVRGRGHRAPRPGDEGLVPRQVHPGTAACRPRLLAQAARQSPAGRLRGEAGRDHRQPRPAQDPWQRPWDVRGRRHRAAGRPGGVVVGEDELTVAKHLMVVLSRAKPGRDAEFNEWYDVHLRETVDKLDGFASGQRFQVAELPGAPENPYRYLALYEVEGDRVDVAVEEIQRGRKERAEAQAAGREPMISVSDSLDPTAFVVGFFSSMSDPVLSRRLAEVDG
ncbi:hypothetical protein [Nocardioides sp. TF02-7]|uniref:hypothetical protein n=1 Tax=Nocardioides sp. TF02-7 TaxID=2917724 RepID=UPI001F054783|nr:hypothetical protein [Nocardioides sp. TF02-7]UMG91220.1 hypothetical protein MF408_13630 [Nocardioides sp. TF02-7]